MKSSDNRLRTKGNFPDDATVALPADVLPVISAFDFIAHRTETKLELELDRSISTKMIMLIFIGLKFGSFHTITDA